MSSIPVFKVVIAGDGAVGKTSLIRRFCEGKFEESRVSTIGVDFQTQRVHLPGGTVKLSIWDMAGQDRFHDIRQGFYRGSRSAALVYDATAPVTLQNLPRWREEILAAVPDLRFVVVANKVDLLTQGMPSPSTSQAPPSIRAGRTFAASIGAGFVPTSALSGTNVPQLFEQMAKLAQAHTQAGSGAR
ncbi:MAG: GTP-binding protein [Chloroflexi bacterium]|jgi:small GTP-binding protein|nr:GTP-binding protein [Chloroflexota bacterium]